MKKRIPPEPVRLAAAKQRRMDQLLEKNREGTITQREKETLATLVAEAERLMADNVRRLEQFSRKEKKQAPIHAVPVTVWIVPQSAEQ